MKPARYYRCRGCATILVSVLKPIKGWPEACNGCRGYMTFLYEEEITDAEYARIKAKGGRDYRIANTNQPRPWGCKQCDLLQPVDQKPVFWNAHRFCTEECRDAYKAAAFAPHPDAGRNQRMRELEKEREAIQLGEKP